MGQVVNNAHERPTKARGPLTRGAPKGSTQAQFGPNRGLSRTNEIRSNGRVGGQFQEESMGQFKRALGAISSVRFGAELNRSQVPETKRTRESFQVS